jgi:hypothetical protein
MNTGEENLINTDEKSQINTDKNRVNPNLCSVYQNYYVNPKYYEVNQRILLKNFQEMWYKYIGRQFL